VSDLDSQLRQTFGDERVVRDAALAPLTTFKVGGPADWLLTLRSGDEVKQAVAIAREHGLPITPLGGGSNLLVSDAGIRGLVLRIHGGEVRFVDDSTVRADAGVTINGLVRWTVSHGVAGIEAWAGTPGTVGGAIYGNAHFEGRLISELLRRVTLLSPSGDAVTVDADAMEFGYDYSRLHRTREIVLSADFRVRQGDPAALRQVARQSLAFRKRTQPLEKASAGCIFQNPDPAHDCIPHGIPPSAGALVDRAGLKDARQGGARVSPRHANFIVNDGSATAADIARLIERCRRAVREKFGVQLRDEIVRIGFDEETHGHFEG
jgi:UDP-N-acetylmuramate dehydrogenase